MICDRCQKDVMAFTGSFFNLQTICLDCAERERAHPDFQKAHDAEVAAVRAGDFNFRGIGLPNELKGGGS